MRKSSIMSCSIGNILEWYDFGLFSIFSALFSQLFFPKSDPHSALLATFSVFAIGFFSRPLGALLFGYLGDKRGRSKTLRLSVLMISFPTLLIGCLPVYDTIGIWSPILLVVIRLWQGLSIGGEFSGNIIYLSESAPAHRRSFYASFAASGANAGIFLAMVMGVLVSTFMDDATLKSWGWRIPYLISGILCLIIYATRLNLDETSIFNEMQKNDTIAENPIIFVFKNNARDLLRTFGLVCMGSTFYYFISAYIPIVLNQTLHLSFARVAHLESFLMITMIFLVPLAGFISDKTGRYKMLLFNAGLILLIIIPSYYFLYQHNIVIVLLFLGVLTIASSLEQGTTPVVLVENFPVKARYTGISFSYNIANGFLGGSVPFVCVWLVNKIHFFLMPAFYIAFYALITLLFALKLNINRIHKKEPTQQIKRSAELIAID
ncbi:MAG: hypothetical protein ACD_60C00159G0004 [uncultured bacterium]|nr:MAG: hypothetical protein ACD_60C00159G0004 [uncultured bacterium]